MNSNYHRFYRMHGLTLVEILVALTLFCLVLTMIFSGLHSSAKSWEKSEAQIAENDSRRLDLGFVRKELAQAVPLVLFDGKDNPVLFEGDHDAIQFISDLPGHRGGGGLYVISLNISQTDHNKNLILGYRPVTTGIDLNHPENSGEEKNVSILEDISSLEFSYFGSKDNRTDPAWSDEWRVKQRLPELVRIHIEPVRAVNYIPDMIVNLHTGSVPGQPQLTVYKSKAGNRSGMAPATSMQPDTGRTYSSRQPGL